MNPRTRPIMQSLIIERIRNLDAALPRFLPFLKTDVVNRDQLWHCLFDFSMNIVQFLPGCNFGFTGLIEIFSTILSHDPPFVLPRPAGFPTQLRAREGACRGAAVRPPHCPADLSGPPTLGLTSHGHDEPQLLWWYNFNRKQCRQCTTYGITTLGHGCIVTIQESKYISHIRGNGCTTYIYHAKLRWTFNLVSHTIPFCDHFYILSTNLVIYSNIFIVLFHVHEFTSSIKKYLGGQVAPVCSTHGH